MNLRLSAASVVMATLMLGACGSPGDTTETTPAPPTTSTQAEPPTDSQSPPAEESSVVIDGKSWTCGQLTGAEKGQQCGPLTQQAFDTYKENIDSFVRSGKLGPLNVEQNEDIYYEDATYVGLLACVYAGQDKNVNAYIDYLLNDDYFKSRLPERTSYLPAWFEAGRSLCPDLQQTIVTNSTTGGDMELP